MDFPVSIFAMSVKLEFDKDGNIISTVEDDWSAFDDEEDTPNTRYRAKNVSYVPKQSNSSPQPTPSVTPSPQQSTAEGTPNTNTQKKPQSRGKYPSKTQTKEKNGNSNGLKQTKSPQEKSNQSTSTDHKAEHGKKPRQPRHKKPQEVEEVEDEGPRPPSKYMSVKATLLDGGSIEESYEIPSDADPKQRATEIISDIRSRFNLKTPEQDNEKLIYLVAQNVLQNQKLRKEFFQK